MNVTDSSFMCLLHVLVSVAHAFDNAKLIHLRLVKLVSLLDMHDISL
jgi:hypothetical protein